MQAQFQRGEVVQFVPEHHWGGCIGFISEVKDSGKDIRYLVGVPVPRNPGEEGSSTAYLFVQQSAQILESLQIVVPPEDGERAYMIAPPFLPFELDVSPKDML